jgi:peroxiredoxin
MKKLTVSLLGTAPHPRPLSILEKGAHDNELGCYGKCHARLVPRFFWFMIIMVLFPVFNSIAQPGRKLPSVPVRGLDGSIRNSSLMAQTGKPVIILFWATWCRPCLKELAAFSDRYGEWKEKTDVIIYAVSVDDSRTQAGIAPMIRSRGWEFEFLLDPNSDFKRAMGVSDIPHMFILNAKGDIIHHHSGYTEGSEELIPEMLKP